jgi:hypothetical protein
MISDVVRRARTSGGNVGEDDAPARPDQVCQAGVLHQAAPRWYQALDPAAAEIGPARELVRREAARLEVVVVVDRVVAAELPDHEVRANQVEEAVEAEVLLE